MDKFLATFSLTYKNKVKTKSFMIFTGLVIVLMLLAANMNKIIDLFDDGPDKVGVVSSDNEIYKVIKSQGDQLDEGATFKKFQRSKLKRKFKTKN